MRQNQQFKRSRGRSNTRKHSNPLSRSFESNGPDVKIRGNANQVSEKYLQLARDAQVAGDSVMEQNYLQHAEHYLRIVMAAQPQTQPRPEQTREEPGREEGGEPRAVETGAPANSKPPAEPEKGNEHPGKAGQPGEADQAGAGSGPAVGAGEGEPKRARRPRRKPRPQGDTQAPDAQSSGASKDPADAQSPDPSKDPADAPQPDLPAFITSSGQASAAE